MMMCGGVLGGGSNDAVQLWDGSNVANKARLRTNCTGGLFQPYGMLSFWVKFNSSATGILFNTAESIYTTAGFQIIADIGNSAIIFSAKDVSENIVFYKNLSGGFWSNDDTWRHVMLEWDLTGTTKRLRIARDNFVFIDETTSNSNNVRLNSIFTINGNLQNTADETAVSIYDVWYDLINPDISLSATRQKFITTGGAPVNLGVNGSTPFGMQPRLFLSGSFSQWKQNKGSAILLDANSGQSGLFNPNTPDYFTKSPTKPM